MQDKETKGPAATIEIDGFVLAGGASSRMGEDKARLRIGGKTFAERAVETLLPVCRRVFVVGGETDVPLATRVPDVPHPKGAGVKAAIHGLHTSFANCSSRYAAILACDMPFVTADLFAFLAGLFEGAVGFDAVIPKDPTGRIQPLCAVYDSAICRTKLTSLDFTGVPSVRSFVRELKPRFVESEEIPFDGDPELLFSNVNTPADLNIAMLRSKG